jgi:hypothetical protein
MLRPRDGCKIGAQQAKEVDKSTNEKTSPAGIYVLFRPNFLGNQGDYREWSTQHLAISLHGFALNG